MYLQTFSNSFWDFVMTMADLNFSSFWQYTLIQTFCGLTIFLSIFLFYKILVKIQVNDY